MPFSDDRKWNIDVAGVNFFANIILFWSIVGFALAFYIRIPLNSRGVLYIAFSILALIVFWLFLVNRGLGQKYYDLKSLGALSTLPQNFVNNFVSISLWLNSYVPSPCLVVVASYILTNIYFSGHSIWICLGTIEAFTGAWFLALRESYLLLKSPSVVTVNLIDGERLIDVTLLKVNPNDVRVRDHEKVKIIYSSQINSIEVKREN